MKVIGLIGGMSWESTVPYYRQINESIKERLGGLHSAKVILYSVDFHDIERLQHAGDWEAAGELLADAARSLELAGADFLVLCTNTMHKVAFAIEAAVAIPLLHIADPTAAEIRQAGFSTVGLLGTRFTMEQDFYRDRLRERHGLQVLIPRPEDREIIHRVIYEELCLGRIAPDSRAEYRRIITDLTAQGAEAIILGCTEISLLVGQRDSEVPLFDTTRIHARGAAEWALSGEVTPNPSIERTATGKPVSAAHVELRPRANMIRRVPKSPNPFVGVWRIVEMELWDKDYIDLEGPGFIKFDKGGKGHFRFGAVQGDLDCRVENYAEIERIEFSWEGNNDADPACGRGWAVLRNGTLHGRLLFHRGDESSFRATQSSRSNHTPNPDARKSGARRLA